jgi:hypothetical protein
MALELIPPLDDPQVVNVDVHVITYVYMPHGLKQSHGLRIAIVLLPC